LPEPIRELPDFEVAPAEVARVADVPVAVDGRRVGARPDPAIGEIDTIDRQASQVPGVDVGTQVARLPAEGAGAISGERHADGRRDRAARTTGRRCGRWRGCWRRCRGWRSRRWRSRRRWGGGRRIPVAEGGVIDVEAGRAGGRLRIEVGAGQRPAPGHGRGARQERPARGVDRASGESEVGGRPVGVHRQRHLAGRGSALQTHPDVGGVAPATDQLRGHALARTIPGGCPAGDEQ